MREEGHGGSQALRGSFDLADALRRFRETKRRFSRFATFDAAVKLAAGFFDPALSKSAAGDAEWSYTDLRWNADIVE